MSPDELAYVPDVGIAPDDLKAEKNAKQNLGLLVGSNTLTGYDASTHNLTWKDMFCVENMLRNIASDQLERKHTLCGIKAVFLKRFVSANDDLLQKTQNIANDHDEPLSVICSEYPRIKLAMDSAKPSQVL